MIIDCLADEFHLQESSVVSQGAWAGCKVLEAWSKPDGKMTDKSLGTKYFSFVPPTSGMFIWVCSFASQCHRRLFIQR